MYADTPARAATASDVATIAPRSGGMHDESKSSQKFDL
jgi:hypothetical protein